MTLTTNGKNYIARNFGINGCFAGSGLSWVSVTTRNETINESGGTGQIVNRLISPITRTVTINGFSYTYSDIKNGNDGVDLGPDDVTWVGQNSYCASSSTPTPRPGTPTPTPRPPGATPSPNVAGTFNFSQGPTGSPTINLNLVDLKMQQNSSDRHFEMNDVKITNTSDSKIYIAAEVRLFRDAQSSCPTSGQIFMGLDRTSTSRAARIKSLDIGEEAIINMDFYQPTNIQGLHTVCLYIHGAWVRDDLVNEITPITS